MTTSQKAMMNMRRSLNRPLTRENELHLGLVNPGRKRPENDPRNVKEAVELLKNPDRFLTLDYCKLVTRADKHDPVYGTDFAKPGCCPEIKKFERAFVKRMAKMGIPVYCSSMWRTRSEQIELYVTGQSPDMPSHSAHEIGQACDLLHADFHDDMPTICWEVFGQVGREISISQQSDVLWGGPLRPHHWEIL